MFLNLLLKRRKKLPWPLQYSLAKIETAIDSPKFALDFENVELFCTFIGYSRSGHSIIAALLDAHPNIVMAHELRAVKYVQAGFSRQALYYLLFQMTRVRGHSWYRGGGYTYDVPGQWQGKYEDLRVIGDKHGEFTVYQLLENPDLLEKLKNLVKVPVKLIHVVRNPYDNIATFAVRTAQRQNRPVQGADIQESIDRYFKICEGVVTVKKMDDTVETLDVYHEKFVKNPQTELQNLCLWLGVKASPDYLESCEKVVFDSPKKSRHKIEWSPEFKEQVQAKMQVFPFFSDYTFEN